MTTVNKTALKKFPLMTPTMGKDVKNAITKYFAQVTAHTSMECDDMCEDLCELIDRRTMVKA